jgi:glycosyltransferase involved in cell wall biosynthesis
MTVLSYAVVTPARNEAENLRRLAGSIRAQDFQPAAWVIVDNGSTDETRDVAEELAAVAGWILVVGAPGEAAPARGGPVARAFTAGIEALPHEPDIVVKVDADISVDPEYFEQLLLEFQRDERLGIAGGTCYELEDGEWVARHVTGDRVRGASRAYRWACLQDVLPFENRAGWDGIDEVRAAGRRWRTRSFAHLRFYHHRTEAARDESRRRRLFETGRSNWYSGYRPSYVLARSLFKARKEPVAVALFAGYLVAAIRREPRCEDRSAREFLRRQQALRRLPLRAREALGRRA